VARRADKVRAIEEAQLARTRLGVGTNAPLTDVLGLIEDAEGIPVTLLPLPKGVAGAIGRKSDRSFIFVSSRDHPVRRRFTLAHEFGHYTLDHDPVVDQVEDIEGKTAARRPEEAEANYFASEFLAPAEAVRGFVQARRIEVIDLATVVRLAAFFGISLKAARIRYEEADFLPKQRDREALDTAIEGARRGLLIHDLGLDDLGDSLSFSRIPQGARRPPASHLRRARSAYTQSLLGLEKIGMQLGIPANELEERLGTAGATALIEADEE
jgi:Zn-dependent peptidase ImmA (M78 family)